MSQRKYLRRKARHNMEKAGIQKMNKRTVDERGNIIESKFSRNWRKYIDV